MQRRLDDAPENPAEHGVRGVGHTGITVTDIARTRKFFIEVLGFSSGAEIPLDLEFCSSITGLESARITAAFVEAPDGTAIELLEYHGPHRRSGRALRTCDPGHLHIAVHVDEIEDVLTRSEGYGWRLLGEITAITVGPRNGGRAAYLQGPDGLVLELVQPPGAAPPHQSPSASGGEPA
ncbi:VOC family protein [Leucobacter weissii]|uniref:VOC family protein n=1 Tax=Leucobacter weissii TaxID=1983706 RepID=A0A939MMB9_9MICO|nr:VOC family protein [Leucobacter weissii]MBO1901427.1 VOC family protein [Leucobacter weissii]